MNHLPMPTFWPASVGVRCFSGIENRRSIRRTDVRRMGRRGLSGLKNVAWADTIRVQPNYPQLSRRNLHAPVAEYFKDEGREAFLKLHGNRYFHIEASKGPPAVALLMKCCKA